MGKQHRQENEKLRAQGYTHTRKKAGENTKRYVYYSLLNKNQDTLKKMEKQENVKVYCKETKEDVTEYLFDPNLKNKKEETKKLMDQGYTHLRFKNQKYYNLKESSFIGIELNEVNSIKVYCKESQSDVTESVKANLKISKRFSHLKASSNEKRKSTKELKEAGYTHKRNKNRKIYDLNLSKYSTEEALQGLDNFKVYDDFSQTDITELYQNN